MTHASRNSYVQVETADISLPHLALVELIARISKRNECPTRWKNTGHVGHSRIAPCHNDGNSGGNSSHKYSNS